MDKLTMKQAIVVSAYTGILICPFAKMHEAIEKKLVLTRIYTRSL